MIELYTSKQIACLKMTILSLFVTTILSGCGIRGSLKTPPPVFGSDSKVQQDRVPNKDLDQNKVKDEGLIDLDEENQDSLENF